MHMKAQWCRCEAEIHDLFLVVKSVRRRRLTLTCFT